MIYHIIWATMLLTKEKLRKRFTMGVILDLPQKTTFAWLDFSRLLICHYTDLSGYKSNEKPSVAICGGFAPKSGYNDWTIAPSISCVKSFGQSSFNYTGSCLWNNLPSRTQSQQSKYIFKSQVKSFLSQKLLAEELNPFIVSN